MARARHFVASALLLGVIVLAYQGCGASEDAPVTSAGAGEQGVAGHSGRAGSPVAGSSAHAGHAGSLAGSPVAGSDAAGDSGAGGDTHAGGNDSVWTSTHLFADVDIQRLEQPESHQLFSWKPCDWTDDPACEETVLDGFASPNDLSILGMSVHDDGQDVRVGATLTRLDVSAITDQDGHVLQAYRLDNGDYYLGGTNVHGSRFALPLYKSKTPGFYGSIVGSVPSEATSFLTPASLKPMLASGINWYVLGSERWAWWAASGTMLSFDASSPSAASVFSSTTALGTVANVDGLQQLNDRFVSVEYRTESGRWKPTLVVSDSLAPAQPLFAPDPAIDDVCPMAADTHLAWFRGFEFQSTSLYKHVELWASPLSSQGSLTAPAKVMDLDYPSTARGPSDQIGGWGRVLFYDAHDNGTSHPDFRFHMVDLVHPESSVHLTIPPTMETFRMVGMTRTHAWFTLEKGDKPTQRVRRWKLPTGGSNPGG